MKRAPSFIVTLIVAVALGPTAPALAQDGRAAPETPPPKGAAAPAGETLAPVVIDGETLFSLRGVSTYPADRRAREIAQRIRALAENREVATPSLTLEDRPGMTFILDNHGQRLLAVFDEDALVEGFDRPLLARAYRDRIAEAIAAYRDARRPALLARHALYALGATLALLLAAFVGRRIVHRLQAGLERRYRARIADLRIQAFQIVKAEQFWRFLSGFLNFAWVLAVLAAVYLYLRYVLMLFPWTRGASNRLRAIAVEPLRAIGLGIVDVIPSLVFLAALFVITRYVLKLLRLFFRGVSAGTVTLRDFDAEWAEPTYRLVRLLVVAFAVVVAYPYIPGSGTDAFKGVSLFIGVIFSLGSSSLIGNLIAGYSMTYRRAFRLGDRVKIGEHLGDVERMRLLVTHLRTPKNEEVVVPNSAILAAEIVNFSSLAHERGLILHTTVGIGYETPWRQVEAMLIEAAGRTPGLMREPPPFVLQKSLGDFCVTYEVNVYCDTPQRMAALYTELHRNILDVFNEYGVQIMTPAYEGDPDRPKVVPKDQWYTAPAQPSPTAGDGPDARASDS
jgi:small-conductance mechanosensitive channel